MIDLNKESGQDVLSLLVAADELEIYELIHHAQDNLIIKKSNWIQQNLVKIMHIVSLYKSFKRLNEYCLKIISEEAHMIFRSSDFLSLEEPMLVSLLERDSLVMNEIEIWNSLIKWGTENTLNLSNQPVSKWTPQDFAALEKTLHQCIPLIRYIDISGNDYFEKVMPYRKIIPKDMKTEILSYHLTNSTSQLFKLLPPRSSPIDSNIINITHTKLISSWIDKKVITDVSSGSHKSRYRFKLLYCGSRDGFEATKFRELSGSQKGTVVIVEISKTKKIIGSYNPSNWCGDINSSYYDVRKLNYRYHNVPDAFTFSFGDRSDLQSAKILRKIGNKILYNPHHANAGPFIADTLYISDQCNKNDLSWYYDTQHSKEVAFSYNFQVDEYEVFQISREVKE
ncbi:1273_t:CDS:1 [Ambispora gerdemannii]|uniref:1273_t:CDS:1 n=1 Tax=Ambispora gerdemannii TaxID=144530 RepID=A0A9N9BQZ8_9GLOM|nr:1273_t:CDS:1 [Ambispora gerdemannii]